MSPLYDFATHSRLDQTRPMDAKNIIIVEGILVLADEGLRDLMDLRIFVETPEKIRFERRLLRDVEERGRTPEGVWNQFYKQVKPMHDEFVEPSKFHADIVSSGTDMHKFRSILTQVELETNLTYYHAHSKPIELYF
jgi:uridine kinase